MIYFYIDLVSSNLNSFFTSSRLLIDSIAFLQRGSNIQINMENLKSPKIELTYLTFIDDYPKRADCILF